MAGPAAVVTLIQAGARPIGLGLGLNILVLFPSQGVTGPGRATSLIETSMLTVVQRRRQSGYYAVDKYLISICYGMVVASL